VQVDIRPIKGIKTAKYNPRKISDQALESLKQSIQRFGFVDPVIVNDRTGVLVGGHQRIKAAKELGLEAVPVVGVNLDEGEEKALNVALNKISGEWDLDLLKGVLEDVQAAGLDLSLTGFSEDEWLAIKNEKELNENSNYSRKVEAPIYQPTGSKPEINELFDRKKTDDLLHQIESCELDQSLKEFLINAAYRHTIFSFKKIAEFYCHSNEEIQELMRNSALVIIDYEKAIEDGYVKITDEFAEQFKNENA